MCPRGHRSCTELGDFVEAPCIPAHYGRAACRVCAPCGGPVYVGREPGERSVFGSVRIDRASGAACPDSCAQTAVRIDSADLRSNAVSARHPHLSSVNLTVNCIQATRTPDPRTVDRTPTPRPTGAHRSALPLLVSGAHGRSPTKPTIATAAGTTRGPGGAAAGPPDSRNLPST